MKFLHSICWLVLGLSLVDGLKAAAPPEIELMTEEEWRPSSTLEVRFSRDMVPKEQLGVPVETGPLVITPPVAGKFTWLSRRSGVFVPSEPPKMGTAYGIGVLPGLKDQANKPIGLGFKASFKTPAFALTASNVEHAGADQSVEPNPEISCAFNRNVKVEGAEQFFRFVDAKGKSVAAKVRYATRRDYFRVRKADGDWVEGWQAAFQPGPGTPPVADEESEEEDEGVAEPILNQLVVLPTALLRSGVVWRLEMKPGVEAITGEKVRQARSYLLGEVEPFLLRESKATSYLNGGRSLHLEFSRNLAPDLDEENAAKAFRITPTPQALRFEIQGSTVVVNGGFERGVGYELELDPSVISSEGQPFEGARKLPFTFTPIKPRVYLPEITGHQLLGGRRQFPIQSVNMRSLHLTALLVDPAQVPAALDGFASYRKAYDEASPDEVFQAVAADRIKGRVIAEQEIPCPSPTLDQRQETMLDWSALLAKSAPGAGTIFLRIEGRPMDGSKGAAAEALIQLTDLGVLWKKVGSGLEVTVFSMATGRPIEGAAISILDPAKKLGAKATSSPSGSAHLDLSVNPAWLLVRHGEDQHVLVIGPEAQDLPMAAFRLPIYYADWGSAPSVEAPIRAYIFTDRPLYRPGETVHIKGIVRSLGEKGLTVEAGREGSLTVYLPNQRGETTLPIRTDAHGAFESQLVLESSLVGDYGLRLKFEAREHDSASSGASASFLVADFQPNAFELKLSGPDRFGPAAEVSTELEAKYYFGGSLGPVEARWTLQYFAENFLSERFPNYTFGDQLENTKPLTLRGSGNLSKNGGLKIEPKLPAVEGRPAKGLLTVEVTDINQQTVRESRMLVRDGAEFYLGLQQLDLAMIGHQEEIVARAIAVHANGEPLEEPVRVKMELVRLRFETVRVQAAGQAVSFRTERREEVVSSSEKMSLVPKHLGEGWEVPPGESARFQPGRAGSYLLKATAHDSQGRTVSSVLRFEVSGTEAIAWDYRNPAQIELVPDKLEYAPGDKARILVKSPFSGEALVSIEREAKILRQHRIRLEGNAPTLEIPVEASDGPNLFVSVVLIRGAEESTRKFKVPEYRYGVCQLLISDLSTQLKVGVMPGKPVVRPGEEVETTVEIRDGRGEAVPDAEVTFFAVDDGVLALTGYERPELRPVFEAPLALGVRTGLSLFELFAEDPADLEYSNKGYLIGGGGLDGPGLKLRSDFPGTACWFPALRSDAQGRLTVKFSAPDAVTRYRLVAVVHAGAKQFGSGESAVEIRKPFIILSGLGQGANQGDEILARAVLRNESGKDGSAQIQLSLDATAEAVGSELTARLELKNGQSGAVDFPVRLRARGAAQWKWTAKLEAGGEQFHDGMIVGLKVGSPSPRLRETYLSELDRPTNDLLAGVNPQLLEGEGNLRVTLSNTRLVGLRQAARELLEYPYGCAEQTVSALIPWIVYQQLGPILPDLAQSPEQVQKTVRAGIEKIFALQTGDGGLGYWPGGRQSSYFASAYGLLALAMLAEQGVELPKDWERLRKYCLEELKHLSDKRCSIGVDEYALGLYALAVAGEAQPAYHERLYARRAELTFEGRALLASAIVTSKGPVGFISKLLDPKQPGPENLSWFGSVSRERALQVLAWTRFDPKNRELGRAVQELLTARVNGHWRTTQENAWALLALARYFSVVEGEIKPVNGSLVKPDGTVPFALTPALLSQSIPLGLNAAAPLGTLVVQNPEKGRLYGETSFEVYPPVAAQPRQDRGYAVARSYRKVEGGEGPWQVGDRILVTLQVSTAIPGHFVAIDDPLPAILEALNPDFRAEGAEVSFSASYREIRSDRVLYFCDHLPAGNYTFQYLARVRTAGQVTAPSTKVEEMYRPERFGLGASSRVECRPIKP